MLDYLNVTSYKTTVICKRLGVQIDISLLNINFFYDKVKD